MLSSEERSQHRAEAIIISFKIENHLIESYGVIFYEKLKKTDTVQLQKVES